jgi:hypothetical protein
MGLLTQWATFRGVFTRCDKLTSQEPKKYTLSIFSCAFSESPKSVPPSPGAVVTVDNMINP